MNELRKTYFHRCPAQTHGMGTHELRLGIAGLFDQACDLAIADALAELVLGGELDLPRVDARLRKYDLDVTRLVTLKRLQALLPAHQALNFNDLSASARLLLDLANDRGSWATHFENGAPPLIDQHVADIHVRVAEFKRSAVEEFGFSPTIMGLRQLLLVCQNETKHGEADAWQPKFSNLIKRSAKTLENYATILKQRPWWKRWLKLGLGRAEVDSVTRQHDADGRLVERRRSQLEDRVKRMILERLTDPLVAMIDELEKQSGRLEHLEQSLRDGIESIDDSVTVTQLVQRVTDTLYDNVTFYMLMSGIFASTGCGPEEINEQLREGIPLAGRMLSPEKLALLEKSQAKQALTKLKQSFFAKAIPSALRIDLTDDAFQLKLASTLPVVCSKARPHLRLQKINGVDEIHETYVHCNPAVRTLLDEYRSGNVEFANPTDDQDFAIPERHVIAVTSTMVGPGQARPEYLKGLYARAQMMGEGTFEPIHHWAQSLAQPLVIPVRPADKDDSQQLFELAAAHNIVAHRTQGNSDLYFCVPMDDTVRRHFRETTVSHRLESADHFVALLADEWFIDFVSAFAPNLQAEWYVGLVARLDADIAPNIAVTMDSLGILERAGQHYRFAAPYDASMPYHQELFETRIRTGVGLTKSRFIDALYQEDDLYTRVLVDVVLAEAAGRIPYRLLTPFAKSVVDQLRG